jgi:hypothetical protein
MERTLEEIAEVEHLWVEEAARRYRQLQDGAASSTPSDEVFARLQARQR